MIPSFVSNMKLELTFGTKKLGVGDGVGVGGAGVAVGTGVGIGWRVELGVGVGVNVGVGVAVGSDWTHAPPITARSTIRTSVELHLMNTTH